MAEGKADNIINVDASRARATTGLPQGEVGQRLQSESLFSKARRAFSRALDRIDTNKENIPPRGKAF